MDCLTGGAVAIVSPEAFTKCDRSKRNRKERHGKRHNDEFHTSLAMKFDL
jgi:hypothetical protein